MSFIKYLVKITKFYKTCGRTDEKSSDDKYSNYIESP